MTPTLPHRNVPSVSPAPLTPEALVYADAEKSDVSIISIAIILLRHRWLIICSAILFFTVFAFSNYTPVKTWTATTTFMPRQRSQVSAGTALLSQLGIGGGGSNSALYLELLKSREILGPVVESTFTIRTETGVRTGRLIDIYNIKNPSKRWERAIAISILNSQAKASQMPTGMMKLTVITDNPELSSMLATKIIAELNRYNLHTRKDEASAERIFIEQQLTEANDNLRQAEDALQIFMSNNRMVLPYTEKSLQLDRLKRQVLMRQDLYTALAKQYDAARTEEIRDNPVISVIEPAESPLTPNPPIWPTKAIMGAVLGAMVGVFAAFVHAYFARRRDEETDEYEQLADLKRRTADDLKHFWRPLGRILATGRT